MDHPVLYLDFDGCLHADDVRLIRGRPAVFVDGKPSNLPLFEYAPLLEQLLQPYPEVCIVLCTSWVKGLTFSRAKRYLPPNLKQRVVGATWHTGMRFQSIDDFDVLSRYETIINDAARRRNDRWLALDNDTEGWPLEKRDRVVAPTDPVLALAQPGIAEELAAKLALLCCRAQG